MSVDEIVGTVELYAVQHVVLTGGEPMIAPQISDLASELKVLGYHITIETAGTVAPGGIACDLASLSPKLLNSAPDKLVHAAWHKRHEAERWKPAVISQWVKNYDYQLKFVISQASDLEEVEGMLGKTGCEIPRHKVHLMPEARTPEALRAKAGWLAELCKKRGYRYAHRLHLDLWGARRGV